MPKETGSDSNTNEGKQYYYFAHERMRPGQKEFADKVYDCISKRKPLFVDAPTGSGKTAAVISPALTYGVRHNIKVIFLTSRHTQHDIAIETIRNINYKEAFISEFRRRAVVADIIGKKNMCALSLPSLYGSDFLALCESLRDNEKCDYYVNTKSNGNMTQSAKMLLRELDVRGISDSKNIKKIASDRMMCPYEIAMKRTEQADIIIADYNHIFNPRIRDTMLSKMRKSLSEVIIIADEAHNLPKRIREVINARLSNFILSRGISEVNDYMSSEGIEESNLLSTLEKLDTALRRFSTNFGYEDEIEKAALVSVINKCLVDIDDIDDLVYNLESVAEFTRSRERPSFCATISSFLQYWNGNDRGILRMVQHRDDDYAFSIRALDPAAIAQDVINSAHNFVAVSATLKPVDMFAEVLGAQDYETLEVHNPFPKENRADLIIGGATTKYSERNEKTFSDYAGMIQNVCDSVPGNVIAFFPSYYILDAVQRAIISTNGKKLLCERRSMKADEKKMLLSGFREESRKGGSILFAVVSGSFGEGVDLPGDFLRAVIVVGLPFENPDLETKKLIEYYDKKYGRGWDYGYLYPAFNRILQNAGRLIRTPEDKGAIIYADSRYEWSRYRALLSKDSNIVVSSNDKNSPRYYANLLKEFYSKA